MLAAFILMEGIHWIYLQHLFFSCSVLLHSGWLEIHLFSICFWFVIFFITYLHLHFTSM